MEKILEYGLSLKSCDEAGGFSGYASVFDVTDAQQEKVSRGAFQESLKAWKQLGKLPKLLWQHDSRKPIGFWQDIREDTHGLFVKGQLLLDLAQGREAYSLLKNGVIDGLSIGFVTVRARRAETSAVRILEEINLQEISLVTFAANPQARVEEVKRTETPLALLLGGLHDLRDLFRKRGKALGRR